MGKITSETQGVTTNHFSHQHPLTLINYQPQQTQTFPFSCSGCNHQPNGLIYTCTTCPYFLHKKCFEMPKKITHPCHKAHPLTLLPKPVYPDGLFKCDACAGQGNKFSYHCDPCGVDLHINCAIMPLSITHTHHIHQLHLTFQNPYGAMNFNCHICKMNGSNHWLYRCVTCGFNAHLKCANTPLHNQTMHNNFQSQTRSTPQPMQQQQQQQFVPQTMVSTNDVYNQALRNQMAINNNVLAQALGVGRGGNGYRQMAQLACGGLDVVGLLGNGLNLNGLFGGTSVQGLNGLAGGSGVMDPNGLSGGSGGMDFGGLVGGSGVMDPNGLAGGSGGMDLNGLAGGSGGMDFGGLVGGSGGMDLGGLAGGGGLDMGGVLGGAGVMDMTGFM